MLDEEKMPDSLRRGPRQHIPTAVMPIPGGRVITVLGVPYVHIRSVEGGDLYLTRLGVQVHEWLQIENWYESHWFSANRRPLEGTSSVYRVPTRPIAGKSVDLVVKNCRVGEDVPIDTHTLEEALGAEFNSPWEEFSLVMEMREGGFGTRDFALSTQRPLAIYVPPECMQLWQSGRSRAKINRIKARHPGIDLDILRQYKLVYEWIPGQSVVELLPQLGHDTASADTLALRINATVTEDLRRKGYVVADMKPQHVIIQAEDADQVLSGDGTTSAGTADRRLMQFVAQRRYSVVDYELLGRTPEHETAARQQRRRNYIDELRHRREPSVVPEHLGQRTVLGIDYVHGAVQSTSGHLWVVGKNPRLFDFFLPERWRKTALWRVAYDTELSYTITKDGVHLLWTPSRVGERRGSHASLDGVHGGYASPFHVFAVLRDLAAAQIPVVAPRAIYVTGTAKSEPCEDRRPYQSLHNLTLYDGTPVLRTDRNYLMIFGFYSWAGDASTPAVMPPVPRPAGLLHARNRNLVSDDGVHEALGWMRGRVRAAGYDGGSLTADDLLVTLDDHDRVVIADNGLPAVRLHGAELLLRYSP